ncbi:MAG: hypothetical protein QOH48_1201, partial [Actinomycetota bacterium]|nr:hypothetical protein [Actinomycetota bacterium]
RLPESDLFNAGLKGYRGNHRAMMPVPIDPRAILASWSHAVRGGARKESRGE